MHLSTPADVSTIKRATLETIDKYVNSEHGVGHSCLNKRGEPLAVIVIAGPFAFNYSESLHTLLSNMPDMQGPDFRQGHTDIPLEKDAK